MSYAVVHMQKIKSPALKGIQIHHQREKESRTNPDIQEERSNEEEQSLTISPSNSTVEKISIKDIPKSQLDESYDGKKVYAVTFSDTANTKHGDLVVYLDESGKKVLGKGFK
ncbi:plasmid recombination protein [Kurthia gibsonii]|uniref:plasmid recombination protein n=1 Tax=Kurthia gibsonii TaxID=33946 RepID=UPI002DBFF4A1|nr:plasmid recombination protein [Kurthia gibsonii]MEB7771074.1 plasmid recombination protein [Kurthia gibsonii]